MTALLERPVTRHPVTDLDAQVSTLVDTYGPDAVRNSFRRHRRPRFRSAVDAAVSVLVDLYGPDAVTDALFRARCAHIRRRSLR